MDNVLAEIQAAEARAADTVAKAKEDGAKIVEDAKLKCTEILESKIKAAHDAADKTVADAKFEADLLYRKILSEYNSDCEKTETTAQANISAAADAIIKNLV